MPPLLSCARPDAGAAYDASRISPRSRSSAALLAAGLACSCTPQSAPSDEAEGPFTPPNVVLISLDTLRSDHVSSYGYGRETTPHLDALAARGFLYENCYSGAPWTLPSHITMLTGLYTDQHRVTVDRRALSPDIPTLAETFQEAGYQTHGLHHPGWIHERHGFGRGFDIFASHRGVEAATEHLDVMFDERNDQPWFLFLHLFDIHSAPIDSTSRWIYRSPADGRDRFLEGASEQFEPGDAEALWSGSRKATEAQIEALVALYDAGIFYVDSQVHGWMQRFEQEGVLDPGILVITSDHGESLGQRDGHFPDHGWLYEEGLRVPLIIYRGDAEFAPRRVTESVHHVDLAPSLFEVARIEIPDYLPGRSLFGEIPSEVRTFSASYQRYQARLRFPDKVVRSTHPAREGYYTDLSQDPGELNPLPESDPSFEQRAAELDAAFEREIAGLTLPGDGPLSIDPRMGQEELQQLRALGYAEQIPESPGSGDVQDINDPR